MPAARTLAQAEAARRNGARSRGPVTPEGKARSSRNALRHGMAAVEHLLLDGEDALAYGELLTDLVAEIGPSTDLEARLVQRLASAMWRQRRADRLEQKQFSAAARPCRETWKGTVHGDAELHFDVARFNAVRGYQAALGREVSRLLRELRQLRERPLAGRDETLPNEPEATTATAAGPEAVEARNEPGPASVAPAGEPRRAPAAGGPLANEPERHRLSRRERRRLAALERQGRRLAA